MTFAAKGPPPGQEDGPVETSFPGGNDLQAVSPNHRPAQDKKRAHLRLVPPPPPPPRPRHLVAVHISAFRAREPLGRTRPLMLTESDLARLIEAAERLEGRAP